MGMIFQVMAPQNLLYLKNEWMNWTDFLHVDANSGKLKIALIIIEWEWSKMGVAF